MSETAQTLIKAALRSIGVLAAGEVPTTDEYADSLESLKMMLRHWQARNTRIYYTKQDAIGLAGATSYTIGSGGDCNTVRPASIRGAYVRDSNSFDHPVKLIDEDKYRSLRLKNLSGPAEYLWYSPEYPLGKIYLFPTGGTTLYIDSLKPLTEPGAITSDVAFPPEYDEAVKYGLAVRLAPEYGKPVSPEMAMLAKAAINDVEIRNFSEQINAARPEIIRMSGRYNIDEG
uniref:Uncharacterized protein n=1 Tax=viral metagenome TaxID=1070528 RepID=A0A6M3IPJ3_9ZZZZ